MHKPVNPALIAFFENKIADFSAKASATTDRREKRMYEQRVRNARLSLARARGSHTTSQWDALVLETRGECVRCGYEHDLNFEKPCKAYMVPLAGGGSATIDNLMPLCRSCSVSRGSECVDWLAAWRERQKIQTPV